VGGFQNPRPPAPPLWKDPDIGRRDPDIGHLASSLPPISPLLCSDTHTHMCVYVCMYIRIYMIYAPFS